jgi:hypothetical protein
LEDQIREKGPDTLLSKILSQGVDVDQSSNSDGA